MKLQNAPPHLITVDGVSVNIGSEIEFKKQGTAAYYSNTEKALYVRTNLTGEVENKIYLTH